MSDDRQETRVLEISDFRNLGITGLRGRERFLLNRSLSGSRLGGLVLLVGSNNSGKSNVLDAVARSADGRFSESDVNDFTSDRTAPSIRMMVASGRFDVEIDASEQRRSIGDAIADGAKKVFGNGSRRIESAMEHRFDADSFERDYGYRLSGRVVRYRNHGLRSKDMRCNPKNPNRFIRRLLTSSGVNPESLKEVYSQNRIDSRIELETEINNALARTSEELDDLLGVKGKGYSLSVRLDKSQIDVSISANGMSLNLDRQSEGFRWLFDFFFDAIAMESAEPGTIVLIDEYGDRLGCGTLRELTSKLRRIARSRGLTFVFATQNPMAIDAGHLDEVRLVVPNDDGTSSIINDFEEFGSKDSDVANSILSGLFVSRNFMRSRGRRTVFVEDPKLYLYLSAFSDASSMDCDVDFIPVDAVADPSVDPDGAIDMMRGIDRLPAIIAGESSPLREAAMESGIRPFSIGEMTGNESISCADLMFSAGDRGRFSIDGLSVNDAASLSSTMQELIRELDAETASNFQRALDYISR